ncbi:response regulator [Methylobacterium oryzihabitans]|uniref:Response regulator n=1 Tax=Methylobacterium oryzihabitans TaxID=2499852 RepID=A0A3S2VAK2_9HYPH|nr:response regulator [Methylobacterium oryzihabitans]RVU18451.1 response regulator [Methylobacterium oryzihabitans]
MASFRDPDERAAAPPPVLLLEDDPILGMMLSDLIEEAGCTPIEVRTAEQAIAILEERTDIRVVVADLDTRGSIMGLKLAVMIRDRWPPIELVLTGSVKPRLDLIPARGVFCDKPFENAVVTAAVRHFARSSGA